MNIYRHDKQLYCTFCTLRLALSIRLIPQQEWFIPNLQEHRYLFSFVLFYIYLFMSIEHTVSAAPTVWSRVVTYLTFFLLMWRIGRAPNSIPIYSYIQQDETSDSIFISGSCSKCFGWYFHPSSGAHTTVSTASGICQPVTAIYRYQLEPV
jgi:hypothetical protein